MLTRKRPPAIVSQSGHTSEGFEHLGIKSVSLLRWLEAHRVEYVLVGSVAAAIRGDRRASGPVAIVAAPYRRNYGRLVRALWSEHARLRVEQEEETAPVKLTEDKLSSGARWAVRCGVHDLDIEGQVLGAPSYQELLYEAGRFELAPDLKVDVASPEHLEHYAHVQRTGQAPEIRISRGGELPDADAEHGEPAAEAKQPTGLPPAA